MAFSTVAKNQALDGITVDRVSLHSGDPGTTGANLIAVTGKLPAVFGVAANGERALVSDVPFVGGIGLGIVTHFGAWTAAGDVFKFGAPITGDQAFNAAGAFTLSAGATKITAS